MLATILTKLTGFMRSSGLTPDITTEARVALAGVIAAIGAAIGLEVSEATSTLFACVLLIVGPFAAVIFKFGSDYLRGQRARSDKQLGSPQT